MQCQLLSTKPRNGIRVAETSVQSDGTRGRLRGGWRVRSGQTPEEEEGGRRWKKRNRRDCGREGRGRETSKIKGAKKKEKGAEIDRLGVARGGWRKVERRAGGRCPSQREPVLSPLFLPPSTAHSSRHHPLCPSSAGPRPSQREPCPPVCSSQIPVNAAVRSLSRISVELTGLPAATRVTLQLRPQFTGMAPASKSCSGRVLPP